MRPLREIRERVGDQIEIMIEGHAFFQLPAALRLARALAEIRPLWLEDILRVDNIETLAEFRRRCGLPIVASEMLLGRPAYMALLGARAADYVMVDPTWAGGTAAGVEIRRRLQGETFLAASDGAHIVTTRSGHFIHVDEPALVIDEIRRVIDLARRRSVSKQDN